jgi:chorismate mutase
MDHNAQQSPPDLNHKRQRISAIDAGILSLLDERMRLAIEIAQIKKETGKNIEDLERETLLLSEILKQNRDTILQDNQVAAIWQAIFKLSKDIQEEASSDQG